jgi:D-alanyl-lipoteichoic acid acyltransferase DltB (MBOAT superfamily)
VSFTSWPFVLFFPAVSLGFFLLAPAARRWWLLASSAVFYAAFVPKYLAVVLGLALFTFAVARLMEAAPPARMRWLLGLGIAGTLGVLGAFKYADFFAENLAWLVSRPGPAHDNDTLRLILPLGLSFQTFQALAYLFEVHAGRQAAERSYATYLLYLLFYPIQVAGPIERPQRLLPQLALDARFDADRVTAGLKLIAWGLFKKMVIADRLGLVVGTVYAAPTQFSGPQLLLATACFSFQVYYDFSGYTDVARGAARVMGIDLHFNFNRPYAARFVGDFWGRWHTSLTTWFRDYVYAPLAGPRPRAARRLLAVWAVFLLSGLWHGAAWHFVAWGGVHAAYLTIGTATARARYRLARAAGLARVPRVHAALRVAVTFGLVTLAWIFFRAADTTEALIVLMRLGTDWSAWSVAGLEAMGLPWPSFRLLAATIAVVEALSWLDQRDGAAWPLAGRWAVLRAVAFAGLVIGIIEFSVVGTVPFIYQRF